MSLETAAGRGSDHGPRPYQSRGSLPHARSRCKAYQLLQAGRGVRARSAKVASDGCEGLARGAATNAATTEQR